MKQTTRVEIDGSAGLSPEMGGLYGWVEQFRFSRPIKNMARDFSDAVLLAEILAQALPAWVQLHNYPSTLRFQQKLSNWETLNRKVLTRLKCEISLKHQEDLANAVPGAIELLLIHVKRATAGSPYLQAKRESEAMKTRSAPMLHRRASCPTERLVSPRRKSRPSTGLSFELSDGEQTADEKFTQQESITSSFSRILQLMSVSASKNTSQNKSSSPTARNRANAGAAEPLRAEPHEHPSDATVPNYAKPTQSNRARVRSASATAKSQSAQPSPADVALPVAPILDATRSPGTKAKRDREKECLLAFRDAEANDLPSCTTEFQEDSFVYFLCGEGSPTCSEFRASGLEKSSEGEQAQVARVIKTLPSGECLLQLYKRVPSNDQSDRRGSRKNRCYSSTPHFIDCCGSMLHNIQHMTYDGQAHKWEWRSDHPSSITAYSPRVRSASKTTQQHPPQPPHHAVAPAIPAFVARRYFFTEVLHKLSFSALPAFPGLDGVQLTATTTSACCLECPSFTATLQAPTAPTVFPKVHVTLNQSLPDRFPSRSSLSRRNCRN